MKPYQASHHHMNKQIICSTCVTYFPLQSTLELCPICLDDRQYIREDGQR